MGVRVAILWHMHQPMYVNPATNEALLPWVRFHATHAYHDMARMLERHPRARVTVNFVPSLLDQLEQLTTGTVRDRFHELIRRPAAELSFEERRFVVSQFFMVNRARCIDASPRYSELFAARGKHPVEPGTAAFSTTDIRDLQVHFPLAWMGYGASADEPVVAELRSKDRGFTEEDKAALLDAQQAIVGRVIPRWRELVARGQVELSTTPYYHPILPLLCDSDAARRAMPHVDLPPRFSFIDDARRQVSDARQRHRQVFGAAPAGMWPAEGSISPEALGVLASEGAGWAASDEGNLFRSTPTPQGHGGLYQAFLYAADEGEISLVFRDRIVSDRIGFSYAQMQVDDAIRDFHHHLSRVAREADDAGIREPLLTVILDGENAWENYEGHGEAFLDAFYRSLTNAPEISTVTMSEAVRGAAVRLAHVHSGSWIESNYAIWIGHPEDNLAWDLLGHVRRMLQSHEAAGDVPQERLEAARQLLLSAEGSDWFWWYGDDFETSNAAEFDALFRDRLIRAAIHLGEKPPAGLGAPISARARGEHGARLHVLPTALIHPRIDGRTGSYADWQGAGLIVPEGGRAAMHKAERLVRAVRYGTDLKHLFLRIEPLESLEGMTVAIALGRRTHPLEETEAHISAHPPPDMPVAGARVAYRTTAEIALPLARFALEPGTRAALKLRVHRDGMELERIPQDGTVEFEIPDRDASLKHWWV